MRTYAIILITECNNCQASNVIARVLPSRGWQYGPRCACGAQTGPMQWMFLGEVKATGQFDALKKYRKLKKEIIPHTRPGYHFVIDRDGKLFKLVPSGG